MACSPDGHAATWRSRMVISSASGPGRWAARVPARHERDRADLGYGWIAGRADWLDSSERRP
jgi:hypothetical protein